MLDFRYYTKFLGRDVLHSPPQTDRAFVANFQTLGYLKGERMVVLQPGRKVDQYRIRGGERFPVPDADPALAREAIAFYQVASHVFRNGLYLDEEQSIPDDRIVSATPVEAAGVHR
jgi:hypothetical protein